MTTTNLTRQEEIIQIWRQYPFLYIVAGFLGGMLFFPFAQTVIQDLGTLLGDLIPEAIGIVFTVLFIDTIYQRRESEREIARLRESLVRDAGSASNAVAKNAVYEIGEHDWLVGEDGLLSGKNLYRADLAGVNFFKANLSNANLRRTNLQEAQLRRVDLQNANLAKADMTDANLYRANLKNANLWSANLTNADCFGADLRGADMQGANLTNTNLGTAKMKGALVYNAKFDTTTILPNKQAWSKDTDLTQFGMIVTRPEKGVEE